MSHRPRKNDPSLILARRQDVNDLPQSSDCGGGSVAAADDWRQMIYIAAAGKCRDQARGRSAVLPVRSQLTSTFGRLAVFAIMRGGVPSVGASRAGIGRACVSTTAAPSLVEFVNRARSAASTNSRLKGTKDCGNDNLKGELRSIETVLGGKLRAMNTRPLPSGGHVMTGQVSAF